MMGTRGDDFLGDPSRNNRISDQFIMDVTQMAAVAAAASAAPSSPSIRSLHRQDIRMSDQFLLFPGVKSSSVIMENTPFAAGRESMLSMESQTSVSTDVDMDSHVQAADSRMHSGDGTGNSNAATAATALDTAFKGDASGSSSSSSTPTTAAGAIASVDGNFVNHANSTQSLSQNISIPPLVGDVDASNMSFLAAQPGGGWPLQADLLSFALPPSDLSSHLGRGDASAPGGTNGTMFYSLPRNQVFQHLPKEDSGQFAVPPRSSASLPRPASKISSDESGGGFSFGDFFPTSSTHPRSGSAAAVAADFTSWQLGTAGLAANTASPFLVSNNVADAVPQPSPLAQPVLDQMVPSPAPFAPQTMDLQQTAALVAQLLPTDTFGLTQSISASPFLAPGRGNQDLTHSPLGSAAPILPLQITTNLMDNGQLEMPISEFDFQSLTSSAGMPDQMISTTEMATTGTQSSSSGTLLPTSRRPSVSAAHVTPAVAPSPQLVSLTSPVLTPTPTPSSATLERFPALAAKAAAAIDSSIKSSGLPVTAAFHKYFPQGHQMVQSNPPDVIMSPAVQPQASNDPPATTSDSSAALDVFYDHLRWVTRSNAKQGNDNTDPNFSDGEDDLDVDDDAMSTNSNDPIIDPKLLSAMLAASMDDQSASLAMAAMAIKGNRRRTALLQQHLAEQWAKTAESGGQNSGRPASQDITQKCYVFVNETENLLQSDQEAPSSSDDHTSVSQIAQMIASPTIEGAESPPMTVGRTSTVPQTSSTPGSGPTCGGTHAVGKPCVACAYGKIVRKMKLKPSKLSSASNESLASSYSNTGSPQPASSSPPEMHSSQANHHGGHSLAASASSVAAAAFASIASIARPNRGNPRRNDGAVSPLSTASDTAIGVPMAATDEFDSDETSSDIEHPAATMHSGDRRRLRLSKSLSELRGAMADAIGSVPLSADGIDGLRPPMHAFPATGTIFLGDEPGTGGDVGSGGGGADGALGGNPGGESLIAEAGERDKPFVCEICDRRFLRKHDLRRHKLIHNEDAPTARCEVCLKTFTRVDALHRHVRGKRCKGPPPAPPGTTAV